MLGTVLVGNLTGTASLARMPAAGGANGDALYLFWVESQNRQLRWSKAQVQGGAYAAWTAPAGTRPAYVYPDSLSTAVDSQNQGIVVAYRTPDPDQFNSLYRHGVDDGETTLVAPTTRFGIGVSVGVDRGDLYLFYTNPAGTTSYGYAAYRRYLPGRGLDGTETVLDPLINSMYPTARREVSDGQADVAWTHLTPQAIWEVLHHRFAVSRPFVGSSGAAIAASCEGFIGILGKSAPPIQSFFVIQQSANGKARVVAAAGTPYPAAEIWQYGGPKGVEQIYHFDPRDYGYTPIDLFNPQPLPIQRTP